MQGKPRAAINNNRLYVIVAVLSLLWLSVESNLFRLQIIHHGFFDSISRQQVERRIKLPAGRGEIFDVNGNKLATNIIHYDLAADPRMVQNKNRIAQVFASTFKKSQNHYLRAMAVENNRFVYLERRVKEKDMDRILKLEDMGLIRNKQFLRHYPYKYNAGQLLGFTDPDNLGLSGIELQFNKLLSGTDGEAVLMYDGPRRDFYSADHPITKAISGEDLFLTIDKNIQTVVEHELRKGVQNARAKSGMAIVMDPYSGAVLAMANFPDFDPNSPVSYKGPWLKRNRAVADIFEPGSTFKVFTAAALLQEQLKKIDDIVFCENGKYRIYNHQFHDSNREGYGWLTFARVLENSSNIGMIKLSQDLPSRTFFKYLKRFGFGSFTEVGLDEEAKGLLAAPGSWSGLSKASISIGHEVGVTAIQLTSAYCAIVNGGTLLRPYLVSHSRDENGNTKMISGTLAMRKVISPEVSDMLKEILKNAVERGTGKMAAMEEIVTGGKTGTAQKTDSRTGKYYSSHFLASFAGFAPFEKPKYVCTVFIDEPQDRYYGGDVAAPVFKEIIRQIINLNDNSYKKNVPEIRLTENTDVPPLENMSVDMARGILKSRDKKFRVLGSGEFIQYTEYDDKTYLLHTGNKTVTMEKMPNLVGLSVREALRNVDFSMYRVIVDGDGIIKKQSVKAGIPIKSGSNLYLTCN